MGVEVLSANGCWDLEWMRDVESVWDVEWVLRCWMDVGISSGCGMLRACGMLSGC